MATYNGQRFIERQLDSILTQSWTDFRLIIGDDASTDKTPDILSDYAKKFPDKISYIPYEDNVGANANFARLLEVSDADYIMLADQDDIWLPDKIADSMHAMQELEKEFGKDLPLLVTSDLTVIDENENQLHASWKKYVGISQKSYSLPHLLIRHAFLGCTLLFNKELLILATPIPLEAGMHDYWLTLVATVLGKIKSLDHSTILYRLHKRNVVGARQYNFSWLMDEWRHNPELIENFQQRILKAYARAFLFYRRYKNSLSSEEEKIFENFIQLKYLPFHKELWNRLKFGFCEQTFSQNLILLYASKKMGVFPTK
jgi:glycosyltransferase involved in cell wall biosynthesis